MDDNKGDEIITVLLPRRDYETVRQIIKERQAMSHIKGMLTTTWIWVVAGGLLALWALWDKIKLGFS